MHFDTPEMVTHAREEGEALLPLAEEALDLVAARAGTVSYVLDVGAGPGVGTAALAARFPDASILAVDGSAAMVAAAGERFSRLGIDDRVSVRQGELPAVLDELAPADVVWASLVVHHVGDEVDALRRLGALLRPGGVLAVIERAGPVLATYEDPELGRPGIWARVEEAWSRWFDAMRHGLHGHAESADYGEMVVAAGLELVDDRVLSLDLPAPLAPTVERFARAHAARAVQELADTFDPADLAALAAAAKDAPLREVHATRRLLTARLR